MCDIGPFKAQAAPFQSVRGGGGSAGCATGGDSRVNRHLRNMFPEKIGSVFLPLSMSDTKYIFPILSVFCALI